MNQCIEFYLEWMNKLVLLAEESFIVLMALDTRFQKKAVG
jgi:hypothetical protein